MATAIHRYAWLWALVLSITVSALTGCGRSEVETATDRPGATASDPGPGLAQLEPMELGDSQPLHQHGDFYLGAQPSPADLAEWQQRGVRTVINLRRLGEIDWDEQEAVESLGMNYVAIPVGRPDALDAGTLDRAIAAMGDESLRPVLLHCATSNRTGAIWYAHRTANDGLPSEQAREEAERVGLRSLEYLEPIDGNLRQEAGK